MGNLIKSINKKTNENELISFSGAIFYKIIRDYPEAIRDIRGLKVLHSSLGEGNITDLTKNFTQIKTERSLGHIQGINYQKDKSLQISFSKPIIWW